MSLKCFIYYHEKMYSVKWNEMHITFRIHFVSKVYKRKVINININTSKIWALQLWMTFVFSLVCTFVSFPNSLQWENYILFLYLECYYKRRLTTSKYNHEGYNKIDNVYERRFVRYFHMTKFVFRKLGRFLF